MYKLVKPDGLHDDAVSDQGYHSLSEQSRVLYSYVGDEGQEEGQDKEDLKSDPANKEGHKEQEPVKDNPKTEQEKLASDPEDVSEEQEEDQNGKVVKRPATQEDLDANPELVKAGVKVGDGFEFSAEPEEPGDEGSVQE